MGKQQNKANTGATGKREASLTIELEDGRLLKGDV